MFSTFCSRAEGALRLASEAKRHEDRHTQGGHQVIHDARLAQQLLGEQLVAQVHAHGQPLVGENLRPGPPLKVRLG